MAVPLAFLKPFLKAIKDIIDGISSGIRGIFHSGDDTIIKPTREIGDAIGTEPDVIQGIIGEFILVAMKFI